MLSKKVLTAAAVLTLGSMGAAQSFNVDVGVFNPVPSSTFGAAANQPGVWNQVSASAVGATALFDISGASTGVTMGRTAGVGADFNFNNPGTQGDDELLLDDAEDIYLSSTWTISGLAAGDYTITTYAWAPDSGNHRTGVSVNGGPQTVVGGLWTTTGYIETLTHAVDTVTISAGGDLVIVKDFGTFNGVQIQQGFSPFASFCSGDGSGTSCPCGNPGLPGHGCANSLPTGGALLVGSGTPSIGSDTMVLTGSGMPDSSALYFQGTARVNGGLGAVFGDGLRCAGGTVIRLGTQTNAGGTSQFPAAGDPLIHVKGLCAAGDTRQYQCWYRNAANFCMPTTFNLSNGLETTWVP